jgi:DNA polymerase III alpha subunit
LEYQSSRAVSHFLIVWDFIKYAREFNIPVVPLRVSADGSLVSYAMRITDTVLLCLSWPYQSRYQ